jgi:hypothetical protein
MKALHVLRMAFVLLPLGHHSTLPREFAQNSGGVKTLLAAKLLRYLALHTRSEEIAKGRKRSTLVAVLAFICNP